MYETTYLCNGLLEQDHRSRAASTLAFQFHLCFLVTAVFALGRAVLFEELTVHLPPTVNAAEAVFVKILAQSYRRRL